jgi:hypothetical protein
VALDECAEGLGRLVVGRIRLERQARVIVEYGARCLGPGAVVVDDVAVVELHTWLHHKPDDALPSLIEARGQEGGAVGGDRLGCRHR